MGASNFCEDVLAGRSEVYARVVEDLKERYGFDFVGLGLTAFLGAPLKWIYSAGATDERHTASCSRPGTASAASSSRRESPCCSRT